MTKNEKILLYYIMKIIDYCPFEDEWEDNLEKECVGFRQEGCGDCILRNIDKLED